MTEDRICRPKEATRLTGLSRTTLHRKVKAGELAPPIKLGLNSCGWRYSTLMRWLEEKEAA